MQLAGCSQPPASEMELYAKGSSDVFSSVAPLEISVGECPRPQRPSAEAVSRTHIGLAVLFTLGTHLVQYIR